STPPPLSPVTPAPAPTLYPPISAPSLSNSLLPKPPRLLVPPLLNPPLPPPQLFRPPSVTRTTAQRGSVSGGTRRRRWVSRSGRRGKGRKSSTGGRDQLATKGSPPRFIDIVWGNLQAEEMVVSALVDLALECGSDHRPIRISLRLNLPPTPPLPPRPLWRKADPASITAAFLSAEAATTRPLPFITNTFELEIEASTLDTLLQAAIAPVPLSRPRNPRFGHGWWSEELTRASREARKARNREAHTRGKMDAETAKTDSKRLRNRMNAMARREKRRWHRERVETADEQTAWKLVGEEEGRATTTSTPPLKRRDGTFATSTTDKFDVLIPELLPVIQPSPVADERMAEEKGGGESSEGEFPARHLRPQVSPLHCVSHSEAWSPSLSKQSATHVRRTPHSSTGPAPEGHHPSANPVELQLPWPPLQEDEVSKAVFRAQPFAACGPDGIPNLILQILYPLLRDRLVPICDAILRLGHLPRSWRDASGVVLKKPKKDDYSLAKSYRLISLERCIAKIPEAIVARRLSHLVESHNLVPPCHFGARRGRGAEEAVACFVDDIKRQWRDGNVVVGIALDNAKAFPSVRTEQVMEDMKEWGLPEAVRKFVKSWMEDRRVKLLFEGKESGWIEWASGLPQGSPLSPIIFLLYNSQLLRDAQTDFSYGYGWVDDLNILAWGRTVEQAVSNAQKLTPNLEGWSKTHATAFETTKTTVTLFLPPQARRPIDPPPIILCGEPLEYSPALGMLGCVIDENLTFKAHISAVAKKAATSLTAVSLLARAKGGMKP
ncbi:hypothetical protein JCM11641_007792, partial [Rhodosporidiobolus odoratus]